MEKVINSIIIVISVILISFAVITGITPNFILNTIVQLGCFIIPSIMGLTAMIVEIKLSKDMKAKKKTKTFWLIFLFIIYCIFLISILFLENEYRLSAGTDNVNAFSKEHFETRLNIIPFKTIISFFKNWPIRVFVSNVGINLLLFAPMGFFVPMLLNDKAISERKFIVGILILIVGIEIIQFISFKGVADIDDVILNILGSLIVFKLMKAKVIKKLLDKIFE